MADGSIDVGAKPTEEISVREVFGIDSDMKVKGFGERTDRVPDLDSTYKFDPDTTLAILAGFNWNRQVDGSFRIECGDVFLGQVCNVLAVTENTIQKTVQLTQLVFQVGPMGVDGSNSQRA